MDEDVMDRAVQTTATSIFCRYTDDTVGMERSTTSEDRMWSARIETSDTAVNDLSVISMLEDARCDMVGAKTEAIPAYSGEYNCNLKM